MPDKAPQRHRTNRVFKSLHKPLTYMGVERTLFYFVCVGAVGAFQFHSGGCRCLPWRFCLRPLGNKQRSGISAHPCKIRTLQTTL